MSEIHFTNFYLHVLTTKDIAQNTATRTYTIKLRFPHIGDYIDYSPSLSNSYNLYAIYSGYNQNQLISQDTSLKWRIFDFNNGKYIDVISDRVTNSPLYLNYIQGYNNGVYILNNICEQLYSNNEKNIKARSVNLIDIEKNLTDTGFSVRNAHICDNITYGSLHTYTLNSYYPSEYSKHPDSGINTTNIYKPDILKTVDSYKDSAEYSNSFVSSSLRSR